MTKRQEAVRKDIERFFGCLQGRFKIMRYERHEWSDEELILISQVCGILHNMISKMNRDGELGDEFHSDGILEENQVVIEEFFCNDGAISSASNVVEERGLNNLLSRDALVSNRVAHVRLNTEITKHLWSIRGRGRSQRERS